MKILGFFLMVLPLLICTGWYIWKRDKETRLILIGMWLVVGFFVGLVLATS